MKEYRKLLVALGLMAFLTPVGLYLPQIMKAGGAWGEWGIHEVRKMIGYAPSGMENTADTWKAPMPDYALPGRKNDPLPTQGVFYLFSAFLGHAKTTDPSKIAGQRQRQAETIDVANT